MTGPGVPPSATVADTFDHRCRQFKDSLLALDVYSGESITFQDLPSVSERLSAQVARSVRWRSGRVILNVQSPFLFTMFYLSLLRCGWTVIPVDPQLSADVLLRIATTADADGMVSDRHITDQIRTAAVGDASIGELRHECPEEPCDLADVRSLEDTALILFTSGTTSTPKGVMLSARSLLTNAQDIAMTAGIEGSRLLGILPLHHTNGQIMNALIPLVTGSTVYCGGNHSLTSLADIWRFIEKYRIEYIDVVPTVIIALLALPPTREPDTSSVKFFICGAAPVPDDVLLQFESRFGVQILQEYGLTEATCVSAMESPSARRLGSVGKPLRGNRIEIRRDDGRAVPAGERGQIWIKGTYTMQAYLGEPERHGPATESHWLDTGDLGVFDSDGFLRISGRIKNVIIKGGITIVPEDIERVAQEHPQVVDVAALGREDQFYGEVIDLLVVWQDGLSRIAELEDLLKRYLPKTSWPHRIRQVDHIPRTSSGKVVRGRIHP